VPTYRSGAVTTILEERAGLQRVEVDGEKAYVLTELIGPVAVGDRVVMNTTAVDLGLGTGGWHVVHWNLSRDAWSPPAAGNELKLRYTSLQLELTVAPGNDVVPDVPIVGCTLHSHVAAIALAFKQALPNSRLVYVMLDGGALPLALSDVVHALRGEGLLDATVTAGHAFGGDAEATTVEHALAVAATFDPTAVVVGVGLGLLGVGSALAFTGRDVVHALDAASTPILAVRYSDAETRERHLGISHHTRSALAAAARPVTVPIPTGEPRPDIGGHDVVEVDVPDLISALTAMGVTSMGRAAAEDPKFWAYAGAAGTAAAAATSR